MTDQPDLIPQDDNLEQLLDYAAAADEHEVARWESTLTDFVDIWRGALQRREKMSPEDAGRIARQLIAETAHYRGGRAFYLPKDDRLQRALRDDRIWEDYASGRKTHAQLATEHQLTVTAIYNIIAKQKKLRTNSIQRDLFQQN